jgi:hypothetical protein
MFYVVNPMSNETKYCTQCKQNKPKDDFLTINKPGWDVVFCNLCAAKNVNAWRKEQSGG